MKKNIFIFLLILQILTIVSCKKSSDAEPIKSAELQISSFSVTGERDGSLPAQATISSISIPTGDTDKGYVYFINLGVTESSGGTATITAVEFTFSNGGNLFGTYTPELSKVFTNTKISGGSAAEAKELSVASADDDPFADEIVVTITYTDETSGTKTTTATYNYPQYEDADLVVVQGTVIIKRLFGLVYAEADVENQGTRAASRYQLSLTFHDSTGAILNGLIKNVNSSLAVNARDNILGVCTTNFFDGLTGYSWRIKWTNADGTQMSVDGEGTL